MKIHYKTEGLEPKISSSKQGNWSNRNIGTYLFLLAGVILSVYPFYWMFVASTLTDSEIFQLPPHFLPGENFLTNITNLGIRGPIWTTFCNSLIITTIFTFLTVYVSSLTGYVFAKFNFRYKAAFFLLILSTMMLPQQVTMIPLFKMMTTFGWQNDFKAIIIPALANSFGVFFMRQNMMNVPSELLEAARIDGCSELKIFHGIVLPTTYPALAALSILSFMQQWGNFMWPLIILQDEDKMTLPLYLSMLVAPGQVVPYGEVLAGAVVGVLPILIIFVFFSKYFISGIYGGAVKG